MTKIYPVFLAREGDEIKPWIMFDQNLFEQGPARRNVTSMKPGCCFVGASNDLPYY